MGARCCSVLCTIGLVQNKGTAFTRSRALTRNVHYGCRVKGAVHALPVAKVVVKVESRQPSVATHYASRKCGL